MISFLINFVKSIENIGCYLIMRDKKLREKTEKAVNINNSITYPYGLLKDLQNTVAHSLKHLFMSVIKR